LELGYVSGFLLRSGSSRCGRSDCLPRTTPTQRATGYFDNLGQVDIVKSTTFDARAGLAGNGTHIVGSFSSDSWQARD